jgi:hypothetical protein
MNDGVADVGKKCAWSNSYSCSTNHKISKEVTSCCHVKNYISIDRVKVTKMGVAWSYHTELLVLEPHQMFWCRRG